MRSPAEAAPKHLQNLPLLRSWPLLRRSSPEPLAPEAEPEPALELELELRLEHHRQLSSVLLRPQSDR